MAKIPKSLMPLDAIERKILLIRGQKVMLDTTLAQMYQVDTGALNRAVRRNRERFPEDFMIRLTEKEAESLRCQIGISKRKGRGGPRYRPFAFTEHGVAMISAVLRSTRAVQMSIFIVRVFVHMREVLANNKELAHKVQTLEREQQEQGSAIVEMYTLIRRLMQPPRTRKPQRRIGFPIP